ncbi:MAG: glycosyltransferase family 4 protein [Acidobacteriaceae bacterium]|nr:glycosyltransferase family 4 protein [Acidobacteriaceae bacterium]
MGYLSILSVGYPLLPVSVDAAGGAEQILALLEQSLVQGGHRSLVVAAEGSKVCGELITTPAVNGEMTEEVRQEAQEAHRLAIRETLEKYEVDLIHFHGLDFYAYLPESPIPKLATLHLPLDWYPDEIFELPGIQLNCVSQMQAHSVPDKKRVFVVPNGIDTKKFCANGAHTGPLLWLGRICPEKGVHLALEVAHQLNLPLTVAGPVHAFREHQTYFREYVEPLLDDQRQWIGAVGMRQKISLLAQARALLIPSLVPETSSLVAMEAISSGTPVVAFCSGALPEVVEDGVTGFIVEGQAQMAEAIGRLHEISSSMCRARAAKRFSMECMVARYMELYHRLRAA